MEKKLRQAQGNWVDGDRFWGRENDLAILTRMIDEGAHISIVAQRRMGKTSLMKELAGRLSDRYICLYLDLQEENAPADAVAALAMILKPHESLWRKTKALFSNVLHAVSETVEEISVSDIGIKLRSGLDAGNWMDKGDELFRILSKSEKPVLLMIDEIPLMVNRMLRAGDEGITKENITNVDRFMSWLRKNSIEHQGKIRIMLSGSIGLEPVLHQAGLSAVINNYQPYDLKPWDFETAAGCLRALANNYDIVFEDEAELVMVEKLGCCIPHHVQIFFSSVYTMCMHRKNMRFRADEVRDLYESEMLGLRGHAELTHYEERLSLYFSKERLPLVKAILTETAVSGFLTKPVLLELRDEYTFQENCPDDALAEMLRILQHDGYLARKKEGYVYESGLLRDCWKKAHEEFYTRRK
ncbi:conserved hypothetical protein [Chlorobium limicola DSM 245]|uniref:ATP-binding protein n=1 Tax=Chlorobium limicola (strain DSM 245 / NBRC 103803 / 6330) TaxID=290315 RepID=B3EHL4_CHLL2|nr:ATP-binding protein [Chlorobium limicola]ACD89794.1 conserved hypothetical protein [Chlorobium limicola DSM 245]